MKHLALAAALSAAAATAALAAENQYAEPMRDFAASNVAPWIEDAVLVDAIKAQNAANAALTQDQIDAADQAWRAEVGSGSTPTISPVIENAVSDFLRDKVGAAGGTITEAFVMDDKGMLVGASDVTSDYWQGDEAKWQKSYGVGAGAVFVDDVEFDESSQTYQGQVSMTIVDPATGAAIGAITIGIDAEAL